MIKRILLTVVLSCLITAPTYAAGITLWSVVDRVTNVEKSESISGRLGYYFGSENGGLEAFIGSTWHPKDKSPQVMSLGVIEHLPDLIDPNNPLPFIPDILLAFANQNIKACPYAGLESTFNFIDEDAGYYGGLLGILAKLSSTSQIEYGIEVACIKGFDALSDVEEIQLRLTLRILF